MTSPSPRSDGWNLSDGPRYNNLQDPESAWFSLVNCHCSIILSRLFCRAHNLHVVSSAARNTCTLTSLSSPNSTRRREVKQFWAKHDGRTCGLPMKSSAAWRSMKTLVPVTPFDTIIRSVFKLGHHHSPSFRLLWCGNSQFHRVEIHFRPSVPQIAAMLRLRWRELWAVGRHVP